MRFILLSSTIKSRGERKLLSGGGGASAGLGDVIVIFVGFELPSLEAISIPVRTADA